MELQPRIHSLLEFLRDDPSDASTKYMLALEYIKAGNDQEALKWMEEIGTSHPEYLPNYYHFGKLLERTGDLKKAQIVYENGIRTANNQRNLHAMSELRSALDSMEEDMTGM
jgi:tetratricopeptide (TPR) repeat protein